MRNIVYGVCGIGLGHTFRQLPILNHFAKKDNVVVFGYGKSYKFYKSHFKENSNVHVQKVEVPYVVGNNSGLDYQATLNHPDNQHKDFIMPNLKAMNSAKTLLGNFDLVISDYEPVSAQLAYATNTPLVTIDQQSKYFTGNFPNQINGENFIDETKRLNLFFPNAEERIACSFFNIISNLTNRGITLMGPVIRDELIAAKSNESNQESLLIYLSSQKDIDQSYQSIIDTLGQLNIPASIWIKDEFNGVSQGNVEVFKHGDIHFDEKLLASSGIISTAGHTLLSEAMFLGTPVYAIPLSVYEQQMNAKIIQDNNFGMVENSITLDKLQIFTQNLHSFKQNIQNDTKILNREPSQDKIIEKLEEIIS